MKRELTLTDMAGYLPYGLKMLQCNIEQPATVFEMHYHPIKGDQRVICGINNIFELSEIAPVLRPMSDLCEEITERGYNDGKPFVPLVEFAKVRYPYLTSRRFITDTKYVECAENDSSGWGKWKMYELELESMSVDELDLLHRLHLDYRDLIGVGLAVSVHDLPTNPYET